MTTVVHETRVIVTGANEGTVSFSRLGNAAASAGRQFAASAKGLGGLVATYAGAAATIFALQQAFSALTRAAAAEQTVEGTRSLAREIGVSGDQILKTVREITKGQLTLQEVAESTNLSLAAGFNTKQIERLNDVALKASRALGRNLSDALLRITRGSAKLEPELLDELGIFTRIEPAVEKYAANLNRSSASLTQYERRQAFVNAVLTEGERKFSVIDTSTPTTQQSFEKLGATVIDLATKFGQFIAGALQPLVDFLNNNVSNAMAGFLLLAGLVASKGVAVLKNSLNDLANSRALSRYQKGEDKLATRKNASGVTYAQQLRGSLSKDFQNLNIKDFLTSTDSNTKQLSELMTKTKHQTASVRELLTLRDTLNKSIGEYRNKIAGEQTRLGAANLLGLSGKNFNEIAAYKNLTSGLDVYTAAVKNTRKLLTDNRPLFKKDTEIKAKNTAAKILESFSISGTDKDSQQIRKEITKAKNFDASLKELLAIRDNIGKTLEKNIADEQKLITKRDALVARPTLGNLGEINAANKALEAQQQQIAAQRKVYTELTKGLGDAEKVVALRDRISEILKTVDSKNPITKQLAATIAGSDNLTSKNVRAVISQLINEGQSIAKEVNKATADLLKKGIYAEQLDKIKKTDLTPENKIAIDNYNKLQAQAKAAADAAARINKEVNDLPPGLLKATTQAGFFSNALAGSAKVAGLLIGGLSRLVMYLSLFQIGADIFTKIFDLGNFDILEEVANLFKNIGKEMRETAKAARELTLGFGGPDLVKDLDKLGLSRDKIDSVIQKSSKDFAKLVRTAREEPGASVGIGDSLTGFSVNRKRETRDEREKVFLKEIDADIQKVREKLLEEPYNLEIRAELKIKLAQKELATKGLAPDLLKAVQEIVNDTGISMTDVGEALGKELKVDQGAKTKILKAVIGDFETTLAFGTQEGGLVAGEYAKKFTAVAVTNNVVQKSFASGSVDAEKYASLVGAVRTRLEDLVKENEKYIETNKKGSDEIEKAIKIYKAFLNVREQELGLLANLEQATKQLREVFGKDIATADKAFVSGLVDGFANIALSQEEIRKNQGDFLSKAIDSKNAVKDLAAANTFYIGEETKLDSAKLEIVKQGESAEKAILGQYLESVRVLKQINQQEDQRYRTLNSQYQILREQNTVRVLEAEIGLMQTREGIAQRAFQYESEKAQLEATIAQNLIKIQQARASGGAKILQQEQAIRDARFKVLEIENQIAVLRIKAAGDRQINPLENLQNILDTFSNFASNNQLIDLQQQINEKKAQVELDVLAKESELIERRRTYEIDKLDREEKIFMAQGAQTALAIKAAEQKYESDLKLIRMQAEENDRKNRAEIAIINKRIELQDAQARLQVTQAEQQKAASLAEIGLVEERLKYLLVEEQIYKDHATKLAEILSKHASEITQGKSAPITADKVNSEIGPNIKTALSRLSDSRILVTRTFDATEKNINIVNDLQKQGLREQELSLRLQIEDQLNLKQLREEVARTEKEAAIAAAQAGQGRLDLEKQRIAEEKKAVAETAKANLLDKENQAKNIKDRIEGERQLAALQKNNMARFVNDFIQNINDAIGDGLERISKSFFEDGKLDWQAGIKEWALQFTDNIRKNVTAKLVAEPIQELVREKLGGFVASLFGVGKNDGNSVATALWVRNADNPYGVKDANFGANGIGGALNDAWSWLFGSSGGTGRIGNNGLPMMGGLESLAPAQSGILDGAWSWLTSFFAGGGYVKGFSSGGLRDRIPSMLEPGEFVLRKNAVNSIGLNNLQQMNAHGKSAAPNVSINVKNEGTQKDAQQGDMRFDGEKWVLDILLRDLENNGATRKAIRGLR